MTPYYPICLQLCGKACVVVGGGKVAEGKVTGLLAAGANVTVVSPDLTPHLQDLVEQNKIVHCARPYQPGDLAGAFIVFCATDQARINQQVLQEAAVRGQLVSLVDDGSGGNFITPAILRRGDLIIAISTNGKAPALAARLKERLQIEIGSEYSRFLELAGPLRDQLPRNVPDHEMRKKIWHELVDSNVIELLAQGDEAAALETISKIIGFPFQPA